MSGPTALLIVVCVAALALLLGAVAGSRLRRTGTRAHAPSATARRVGRYTLAEEIGAGAMGQVFRARHDELGMSCALKVLRPDATERARERFVNEARLTARLRHPNIVRIHDLGCEPDGTLYYAMELLDGVTLRTLVEREGAQPADRVVAILSEVAGALEEAHAAGLIHRDVKPDNIVLCREDGRDVVKLLDFGLVRDSGSGLDASQSVDRVVGTPLYLSPEAIAAPATVSARSDLYALGAVGYFLLTGREVFHGATMVEVCSQHLYATPERPSLVAPRAIPRDLEELILECLAKRPEARPKSAGELARRLSTGTPAAPEERAPLPWRFPREDRRDFAVALRLAPCFDMN